jgi:hypothetical protein
MVREGTLWMPRRLRDLQLNKIAPGAGSFVTLTKVAGPPPVESPAEIAQTGDIAAGISTEPPGVSRELEWDVRQ